MDVIDLQIYGVGRFFIVKIGLHEVAFSTYEKEYQDNMIYMDSLLIVNYEETVAWLETHKGGLIEGHYKSALEGSLSACFEGDFNTCRSFLRLPGAHQAVVAHWTEALLILQEKSSRSINSRHHNYNAITEIVRNIRLDGYFPNS